MPAETLFLCNLRRALRSFRGPNEAAASDGEAGGDGGGTKARTTSQCQNLEIWGLRWDGQNGTGELTPSRIDTGHRRTSHAALWTLFFGRIMFAVVVPWVVFISSTRRSRNGRMSPKTIH